MPRLAPFALACLLVAPNVLAERYEREDNAAVTRTALEDEAISTSGDHVRFFEEDGVRYHHTRVPGTGKFRGPVPALRSLGRPPPIPAGSRSRTSSGAGRSVKFVRRVKDVEAVIVDNEREILSAPGLEPPEAAGGRYRVL